MGGEGGEELQAENQTSPPKFVISQETHEAGKETKTDPGSEGRNMQATNPD